MDLSKNYSHLVLICSGNHDRRIDQKCLLYLHIYRMIIWPKVLVLKLISSIQFSWYVSFLNSAQITLVPLRPIDYECPPYDNQQQSLNHDLKCPFQLYKNFLGRQIQGPVVFNNIIWWSIKPKQNQSTKFNMMFIALRNTLVTKLPPLINFWTILEVSNFHRTVS